MEKLNISGVTLQGYAQGGIQTSIYCPEVQAVFDTGCILPNVKVNHYFITHGHPDHIMALPNIIGKHSIANTGKNLFLYVPELILNTVGSVIRGMNQLFGDRTIDSQVNLIGVKPGDEILLSKNFTVQALETFHRGPSIGYCVKHKVQKLKKEFQGLNGSKIAELRKSGVNISYEKISPLLTIPGDTQIDFLLRHEIAQKSKVLVHEVTQWSDQIGFQVKDSRKSGHTHFKEMIEHCEKFEGEALVLCHRSRRHTRQEVEEIVRTEFPSSMLSKIHLFDGNEK